VRQATVQVEGHPDIKAVTGLDGSYQLKVPPGTYAVQITSPNHLAAALDGIVVEAGGITDGSTVMAVAGEVTTVDVVERIDAVAATADTMIAERKLAPVVSDGISGEEIRDSTASDAAGALEKVTGVSVVEGGYVYVRGLGERYSTTMLNNAMLPTTEPERRVVPLDLFPANLIDSVKVLKTYTPDLPGEFSGGLVQMQTVEFPTARARRRSRSSSRRTRSATASSPPPPSATPRLRARCCRPSRASRARAGGENGRSGSKSFLKKSKRQTARLQKNPGTEKQENEPGFGS
jgi:hypothetical protein